MIKKLLKHIFQPQKVIDEMDLSLRLQTAIKHIDSLETIADGHAGVLVDLVNRMEESSDPEMRLLAGNIKKNTVGAINVMKEMHNFRVIFNIDKV
ncbi:hypothetical protein pEaSNUABM9_00233 [Erwinia phage pEa_SNUABM_9]|nr:hypothetical protein pEaSNUABM9_00233 [Erwinia phage pEa_SNUABM_9]